MYQFEFDYFSRRLSKLVRVTVEFNVFHDGIRSYITADRIIRLTDDSGADLLPMRESDMDLAAETMEAVQVREHEMVKQARKA